MIDHLSCDGAVLPANQSLGVFLPLIAGDEVKRHPHLSLIFRVEVRHHVICVMGCRVHIQAGTVLEPDCVLSSVVVDELRGRRDDAAILGSKPRCLERERRYRSSACRAAFGRSPS